MAYNQHVQEVVINQERAVNKTMFECINKYGPKLQSNEPIFNETTKSFMCPAFFDTILCWPPQPANTTATLSCPHYMIGFIPTENATRQCMNNGQWYTKKGSTFTNYAECYKDEMATVYKDMHNNNTGDYGHNAVQAVKLIKTISETGFAISLISLIIAFTIIYKIKKLHCARNILHMNLFASFILRYFMQIIKDTLFDDGLGLPKDFVNHDGGRFFHVDFTENNFECKLIVTLVMYFMLANYSWILMEGLYLNNLILRALFTDSNKSVAYITFGWGLPLFVIIPWIVARITLEDNLCWTGHNNHKIFMIILIPTVTSVLINLVLFVIISVVLYRKLKSPNENSRRYLKWAKSTLILVPLFGVNYAVFLIFYFTDQKLIWMLIDKLFGSFQGFFVAILYCFLNGEVRSELKPHSNSLLIFLATNNATKYCFPRRQKYLSSAAGRQSVCTTMSCSSLYNNGVNFQRNSKTKFDQLSKAKLTNLHAEPPKESNNVRISSGPKATQNGNYTPNLTFVHTRNPMNVTTTVDTTLTNEIRPHHYSQILPICEEEVSMLSGENNIKNDLELGYEN